MSTCRKCNLDHQRLGLTIDGTTLHRSANKDRHMLRANGGAWSFESSLLTAHREVDYIVIVDRQSGETWRAARSTFDANAFDFAASGRPQKALALQYWDNGEREHDTAQTREPEGVQMILSISTEPTGSRFEKAKQPRPRLAPPRRW